MISGSSLIQISYLLYDSYSVLPLIIFYLPRQNILIIGSLRQYDTPIALVHWIKLIMINYIYIHRFVDICLFDVPVFNIFACVYVKQFRLIVLYE